VGGSSGPFADEISWDEIATISGAPKPFPEYTSVTKRLRRVARFDIEAVKLACQYNRPISLAVMGLDRIDFSNTGVNAVHDLTTKAKAFLETLERATGIPVEFVGTGFGTFDSICIATHPYEAALSHA
jgi:adenylosuccinate synthase